MLYKLKIVSQLEIYFLVDKKCFIYKISTCVILMTKTLKVLRTYCNRTFYIISERRGVMIFRLNASIYFVCDVDLGTRPPCTEFQIHPNFIRQVTSGITWKKTSHRRKLALSRTIDEYNFVRWEDSIQLSEEACKMILVKNSTKSN